MPLPSHNTSVPTEVFVSLGKEGTEGGSGHVTTSSVADREDGLANDNLAQGYAFGNDLSHGPTKVSGENVVVSGGLAIVVELH